MKLVIDKNDERKWRWSLVTIHGMSAKVHDTGTVEGNDPRAAFEAGWAAAIAKGYVKDEKPADPTK